MSGENRPPKGGTGPSDAERALAASREKLIEAAEAVRSATRRADDVAMSDPPNAVAVALLEHLQRSSEEDALAPLDRALLVRLRSTAAEGRFDYRGYAAGIDAQTQTLVGLLRTLPASIGELHKSFLECEAAVRMTAPSTEDHAYRSTMSLAEVTTTVSRATEALSRAEQRALELKASPSPAALTKALADHVQQRNRAGWVRGVDPFLDELVDCAIAAGAFDQARHTVCFAAQRRSGLETFKMLFEYATELATVLVTFAVKVQLFPIRIEVAQKVARLEEALQEEQLRNPVPPPSRAEQRQEAHEAKLAAMQKRTQEIREQSAREDARIWEFVGSPRVLVVSAALATMVTFSEVLGSDPATEWIEPFQTIDNVWDAATTPVWEGVVYALKGAMGVERDAPSVTTPESQGPTPNPPIAEAKSSIGPSLGLI